nr:hypothetical protein [Sicyoidochytrium minutum DNA virus]
MLRLFYGRIQMGSFLKRTMRNFSRGWGLC